MTAYSPLPEKILPRVGQLLRLLDSDQDHETLAACRALRKTLKGAKVDLHDLASAIEEPKPIKVVYRDRPVEPPPPPPPPQRPVDNPYVGWSASLGERATEALRRALADASTSEWERGFITSVLPEFEKKRGRLTLKQSEIVKRIMLRMEKAEAAA
ncbi:hypothetical protein [Lichenibacterium dinghuense]|uniref:hypothetical protein n=1 Tax=Lichenibacterium dinghuense TaxID=2895977 RepID=UPI001F47B4F2|nr:hypothetical protein [Lichenibacterium sp. 6Y81]